MALLFTILFMLCFITVITACPSGTYRTNLGCVKCSPGCDGGRVQIQGCSQNRDIECQCPKGKFWETALVFCKKCTTCKPGDIYFKNCSHLHDSVCMPCGKGTFAKTKYTCAPCTHCNEGQVTKSKCTSNQDTVCKSLVNHIKPSLSPVMKDTKIPRNQVTKRVVVSSKSEVYLSVTIGVLVFLMLLMCVFHFLHIKRILRRSTSTKKTVSLTSVGSSEHETFINKKSIPVVDHDPGYLVRDLNPEVIIMLSRLLNPPGLKNWTSVASELGFKQIDIQNFNIDKEMSFQKMIEAWSTQREATVYKLYQVFLKLGRDDCSLVLEDILTGVV